MKETWEKEMERLKALSPEQARAELSNAVYQACAIIERLEGVGRIVGNGHHIRQEIAKYAADKLAERLREG